MKTLISRSAFLLSICLASGLASSGCTKKQEQAKAEGEHGHVAAHGGCLNAIGACEIGHAEVKIEDGTLKCWFVGGGNDTGKAVRVSDKEITLTVTDEKGAEPRTLVLKARPLELADEKSGDCSYFEGSADWLKGITNLKATGAVTFKGTSQTLTIDYPGGYDPDHDKEEAGSGTK